MGISKNLLIIPTAPFWFEDEDYANTILPEEIWKHIFEFYLNEQDLQKVSSLSLVCKKFYRIVTHFPFFCFTKFLKELSEVDIRRTTITLHPILFDQLRSCHLKRTPIIHWSKIDREKKSEKGIYNLIRTDFIKLIYRSQNLLDNSRILEESCEIQEINENNLLSCKYLYDLVKQVLKYAHWMSDVAYGSSPEEENSLPVNYERDLQKKIPDPEIREIILGCKIQLQKLGRRNGISQQQMQEVFDKAVFGLAADRSQKEIHHLIFARLSLYATATNAKNCPYDTAIQLIENTTTVGALSVLWSYLATTPIFDNPYFIKLLALQAIKNNPLILKKILEYLPRFPEEQRVYHKRLFALTALRINPEIDTLFKDLFEKQGLSQDEWIMYEKDPQRWAELFLTQVNREDRSAPSQ